MTGLIGLCAICTNDGEGAMQALDGREVFVCNRCETEHPRSGGYDASTVGQLRRLDAADCNTPGCMRRSTNGAGGKVRC